MTVRKIIGEKPIQTIETIAPEKTLSDAVAVLGAKKIGALVVTNPSGEVAGILSERDIVRLLAVDGVASLSAPVSSAMTQKVTTCAPADSPVSVLQRMTTGRFRHMPVMEEGQLIGVVSIGDVVKFRIAEIEMENRAMEDMIKGV